MNNCKDSGLSLHMMSDSELLLAGIVVKHKFSKGKQLHLVSREEPAFHLAEVREEWKARFPNFPLCVTFD
jgi:hypothetical protein